MNTTNYIRAAVAVAIVTWPSVESYRLFLAQKDLKARVQLQRTVEQRVASAQQKSIEVAKLQKIDPAHTPSKP